MLPLPDSSNPETHSGRLQGQLHTRSLHLAAQPGATESCRNVGKSTDERQRLSSHYLRPDSNSIWPAAQLRLFQKTLDQTSFSGQSHSSTPLSSQCPERLQWERPSSARSWQLMGDNKLDSKGPTSWLQRVHCYINIKATPWDVSEINSPLSGSQKKDSRRLWVRRKYSTWAPKSINGISGVGLDSMLNPLKVLWA